MRLAKQWHKLLTPEFEKKYMDDLEKFLIEEYKTRVIYPEKKNIFRALQTIDYDRIKVCILGQDPYHGSGQANGFAFAVDDSVVRPPSLRNIFKEIQDEYGKAPDSSTLEGWAEQGVLLLNTVLTVRADNANSHKDRGWERFTDKVIELLGEREEPIVFILWGNAAKSKKSLIKEKHHIILEAPHPSPLSAHRGFFGCNHFKLANDHLKDKIDWTRSGGRND